MQLTFPSLKLLRLWWLRELESICDSEIVFPALESLKIGVCSKLKKLPFTAQNIPPELRSIVSYDEEWWNNLKWEDKNLESSLYRYTSFKKFSSNYYYRPRTYTNSHSSRDQTKGDVLAVLIPTNTPIPVRKVSVFTTFSVFVLCISIKICEGKRARSEDNNLLGHFNLDGILLAPRGVPKINVCFEIDADGILNVTAEDTSTGQKRHMTLTNVDRLSKEEIERMIEDAEMFKAEDVEHMRKVRARNKLENFAYALRNAVKERKVVKSVPNMHRKFIRDTVKLAIKWLERKELLSEHVYEHKMEELKRGCFPHLAKMYQEYHVELDNEDDIFARMDLLRIGYFYSQTAD